jgi:hypothetical protein
VQKGKGKRRSTSKHRSTEVKKQHRVQPAGVFFLDLLVVKAGEVCRRAAEWGWALAGAWQAAEVSSPDTTARPDRDLRPAIGCFSFASSHSAQCRGADTSTLHFLHFSRLTTSSTCGHSSISASFSPAQPNLHHAEASLQRKQQEGRQAQARGEARELEGQAHGRQRLASVQLRQLHHAAAQ